MTRIDPKTPAEWQEAVNAAAFCLRLHAGVLHGLVEPVEIDVPRCEAILEMGKRQGIIPRLELQ